MGRKKRSKAKGSGGATVAGAVSAANDDPANDSTTGNETRSTSRRSKSNNRKTSNQPAQVAVRLADQPGKLTKDDLTCPICWSIFLAPTTLPCNHSMCEACFRKHVDETSLSCPCCRMRLSIWCRKTMKNNQLLDEPLWERMKKEFPKAVAARINGEDSQNIMEDSEDDLPVDFLPKPTKPALFDGIICQEAGEVGQELQKMMKQHEKDLEAERVREETASANLIKQLQDEEGVQESDAQEYEEQDFILAQKLQQEFQAEERLQRTRRSTQQQDKSLPRNLMKQWINNNNYSPDICELPIAVQSKVKPLRKSSVSNSAKAKNNGKQKSNSQSRRKSSSSTITLLNVSKASQNVMSKFLSSSQNHLLSPEPSPNSSTASPDSIKPCCSKSLPVHDVRFSAFSPTKPSTNMRLIVPAESLAIPISVSAVANFSPIPNRSTEELGTSTKTPDSINSEVDRHFRPIRGAPKTPPQRRPDGKFLPEPKLLRLTPIKPGGSTSIAAYICSPLKQMPDGGKPSCATTEKRISNDSGRASDDSRSPDVDGIGQSPATSVKGSDNSSAIITTQSYQNERGCISEDYRVTPEDNPRTPENSKKRLHGDDGDNKNAWDIKKMKIEPREKEWLTPKKKDNEIFKIVKNEIASPSQVKAEGGIKEEVGSPSLLDEPFGHVPLSFDITCSQGIITIGEDDEEYLDMEAEALKAYRKKAEQEAADRAFAEALQRDLNRGIRSPRGRGRNSKEKYSLRSWLNNPQIKREIKEEN